MTTARPHVFTAGEFLKLDGPEHTELRQGVIYDVSPRNEPHRLAVRVVNEALVTKFAGSDQVVQIQDAVAVPGWHGRDAPEVDIAVLKRRRFDPGPTAEDASGFVEVSDTTYSDDRSYKIPLYVNAGVPAWIVNIPQRRVEFYGSPADLELPHGHVFDESSVVDILGARIAVSDLF